MENKRYGWGEQALHTTHQYDNYWRASPDGSTTRRYETSSCDEKRGRSMPPGRSTSLDGVNAGHEERSWMRKFDEDKKVDPCVILPSSNVLQITPRRMGGRRGARDCLWWQKRDAKNAMNLDTSKTERDTQAAAAGRRARTTGRDRSSPRSEAAPPSRGVPREWRLATIEPAQAPSSASTSSSPSSSSSPSASRIHLLQGKNGRFRAIERFETAPLKGLSSRSTFWSQHLEPPRPRVAAA